MSFRTQLIASYVALLFVALAVFELWSHESLWWGSVGFALVFAVVLGVFVARRVAGPVKAMTRAAAKLAEGRFDLELPGASGDELGALARSLGSVSARLRAEITQLKAERDCLSALVDGMGEGVLVINEEQRIAIANQAALAILSASSPLVGRTVAEAIRHPRAQAAIEAAVKTGLGAEVDLEPWGNERRAILFHVRAIPAAAGGGVVAVIHDVTHIRRLETVRRDFVTNVSHELRTPVASIQGYAETLLDGALDDRDTAHKFVEVIHRNAGRLGRLVADLLQLSRLEARTKDETVRRSISLGETAAQVFATVRDRAAQSEIALVLEVPEDLYAVGDPDGVEQMLLNLVDNALKYGKRGGHVRITAKAGVGVVVVAVVDDGQGIESRHLARIFERFYRVDESRSSEQGSTGLGLAIVSHLAESMGGSVCAESELGRGSRFVVTLPALSSA